MANNKLDQLSEQELAAKNKSLGAALAVILGLAVLYAAYYLYLFATGNFDPDRHLLGLVPLAGVLVIAASTGSSRKAIQREMSRRR